MNIFMLYLCTIAGSLSGALALVVPELWFLAPVALAFLYADIQCATSRNDAFLRALFFGVVTGGASIWWAWGALPFLWLGYTSVWEGAYVMAIIWGLVSLFLGIAPALYGVLVWLIRSSWYSPAVAVLLWPVTEWGRMWSFGLLAAGENSLIGPHFSFGSLGLVLTEFPALLPVAALGGMMTLSLVLGALGICVYFLVHRNEQNAHLWSVGLLGVVIVLTMTTPNARTDLTPLTIAVAHTVRHDVPALPPTYTDILKAVSTDILIFPEDLYMFGSSTPKEIIENIRQLKNETLVVTPRREIGEEGFYRSLVVLTSSTEGELGAYQKKFLMPESEYLPFLSKWIFAFINDPRVTSYFSSTRRLLPGDEIRPVTFKGARIGALMCSDIISPSLYRVLGLQGATIFINTGDHTWFNSSRLLHARLKQMAKVHAVESSAYMVVANRGSPSYIVSPAGILIAESEWGTEGILYAKLK